MNSPDQRRQLIADAALAVLGRLGSRGLTHRAVDNAASLPAGSTSYYFNSRAELIGAAARSLAALDRADIEGFAGTVDVNALFDLWISDSHRERLLARFELFLLAARDDEIHQHMAVHRASFVRLVAADLKAKGEPCSVHAAEEAIAMFEGRLLQEAAFGAHGGQSSQGAHRQLRHMNNSLPGSKS